MKINLLILLVLITAPAFSQVKNMDSTYSIEIIRYKIEPANAAAFEKAYAEAGKLLQTSSYCQSYQVIHGVDEPGKYIVIIHWTSKEEHLNGFRKSSVFPPFFSLVRQFYNNIEEMKHYEGTTTRWRRQ